MLVMICLIASLTWYVSNLPLDIVSVLHPLVGLLINVIKLTFSHFANLSRAFQNFSAAISAWSDFLMPPYAHIAQSLAAFPVFR